VSKTTLYSLKEEIESEVKDEAREIYEARDGTDRLHEMADSSVPVYNADLAEVLASDPEVAYMDDPGLAEGCDDLYRRIAISIYEKLCQHAHETWNELKDEIDEALDEIDDLEMEDLIEDASVSMDQLVNEHPEKFSSDQSELLTRAAHESDPDWQEENEDDIDDARADALEAFKELRRELFWDEIND